jgi:outer membrane protein insertion porin family
LTFRKLILAAATVIFAALTFLAADPVASQDSYRVVEVEVIGNRVATTSLIMGVAAIDLGSPLTAPKVQETIQRLYGLGIFQDVSVEAETVSGGIKVYIVVKELPKLSGLEFSGNKKIDAKTLKEQLRLGVGGYISPYLIHEKKQEILEAYSKKGYFQAEVTPVLAYSDDSTEAALTYRIAEKSKVKVENVVMTGNVRVNADDLIGKMRNRKRGFLLSSDFAQDKYAEDLEKVIEEYHKKGFIDAYLISDSMTIDTATNKMTIYLEAYEGPRYYFGEVTFEGSEKLREDVLRDVLKFDSWDEFNSEDYDESLFELYSAYQEIGHLHVRIFDEKTTRNDSLIDISYTIAEGLPSHINLVRIVGNRKTRDKVIRRELSSMPGQVFSRALLIRSVRDVMALNFFANVEPVPIDLPSGDVDLEFKVEEKQTAQISAGAGYNSQDKLVGSVGMGIPNFRGNGQNLSFNVDFGSRRNSFSLSFTEPWLFGRPTLLGTDMYMLNRRWFEDYTEGRQGGSIRIGRRLRWPDNYFRVYASYRLERNRFYDFSDYFANTNRDSSTVRQLVTDTTTGDPVYVTSFVYGDTIPGSVLDYREQWNDASRMSFTIRRDSRDLPEFATTGSDISYTFSNTGYWLGGFWEYQKHEFSVAKFIPLIGKLVLAAKLQIGAIAASDDDRILVSDRFNPGGIAYDGVVRGYDDGELTPDTTLVTDRDTLWFSDPNADPETDTPDSISTGSYSFPSRVRGKYMVVTNVELQFPLIEQQLYALAFFDAGNSWLRWRDVHMRDMYRGVGFGFRLVVPGMGTLGFDFGYPLDSRYGEKREWQSHFQVGTTFR